MSKAKLVITAITVQGLSQAEAARTYGLSQAWVSRLMARYKLEGEAAFEPRSRRPKTSPNATPTTTIALVVVTPEPHLPPRVLDTSGALHLLGGTRKCPKRGDDASTTQNATTNPRTHKPRTHIRRFGACRCPETPQGYPRQDSNLRSRLRRAVLYPLSYGGRCTVPRVR